MYSTESLSKRLLRDTRSVYLRRSLTLGYPRIDSWISRLTTPELKDLSTIPDESCIMDTIGTWLRSEVDVLPMTPKRGTLRRGLA